MPWPWVSRLRLEALEDKYDDLAKHYAQLQEYSEKLLDSMVVAKREDQEKREQLPDPVQQPRRLFSRDIREKATAAMDKRHRETARP